MLRETNTRSLEIEVHQEPSGISPNTAVKVAPFGRWTLRERAPRSAPYLQRWAS